MLRSGGGGSSVGNEFVPNSASSGITLGVLFSVFLFVKSVTWVRHSLDPL